MIILNAQVIDRSKLSKIKGGNDIIITDGTVFKDGDGSDQTP